MVQLHDLLLSSSYKPRALPRISSLILRQSKLGCSDGVTASDLGPSENQAIGFNQQQKHFFGSMSISHGNLCETMFETVFWFRKANHNIYVDGKQIFGFFRDSIVELYLSASWERWALR